MNEFLHVRQVPINDLEWHTERVMPSHPLSCPGVHTDTNLKIRKSFLISRLPYGIVQILNRYISWPASGTKNVKIIPVGNLRSMGHLAP